MVLAAGCQGNCDYSEDQRSSFLEPWGDSSRRRFGRADDVIGGYGKGELPIDLGQARDAILGLRDMWRAV